MATSNGSKLNRYVVNGLKLTALINLAIFTAFEAVIYYKHSRFATWQDISDLIAIANGKSVVLKQLELDINDIQKQGSLLEAESEMLRVKLDDERLACLRRWDDVFEELKLPKEPFIKKSDVNAIEKKLAKIYEEMDQFKHKFSDHIHEVAHLKQYFQSLNSPNKNIEYHIEDLNDRIQSIMSTIQDTFKSPQVDAFLEAVRSGPFLEETDEIVTSKDSANHNENKNPPPSPPTPPQTPKKVDKPIETPKIENIAPQNVKPQSSSSLDVKPVKRESQPQVVVVEKEIVTPIEPVDPDIPIAEQLETNIPMKNTRVETSNVDQMEGIFSALTKVFMNETEEKLTKQKLQLEAHHKLNLEEQSNLIKLAFTDKYSSLIDQIKLILNRTTRTQRLLIDALNLTKINNLLNKADHYLKDSDTKPYPRGYLAGILFEILKRSDISYGYSVGVVADTIPSEVLMDGVDSQYSLIQRFHSLKKDASRLAYLETKEMNLWNFFISYLHSLIHSNNNLRTFDVSPFKHYNYCCDEDNNASDRTNTEEQSPFEVYCLLEKADQAVTDGRLDDAACYISHIKNHSGHTMRRWLHDVHNYLVARQAVSLLQAYASNNQIVPINSKQSI